MDTPRLRNYLSLGRALAVAQGTPGRRNALLAVSLEDAMDAAWYALTPEELAWLDTREGT